YHQIGQTAADTISRMLQAHRVNSRRLLGISIGIPAVIDYTTRQVLRSTVLPVSGNLSFMEPLQQCFPRSFISLGNQSGFCAYAEKTSGAYESLDHLIYLDINIGVGAGLIIDNHIFSGSGGMAAEIGHTTVDVHGRRCKCGNLGCLETMVSVPAIKGRILSALVLGRDSLIKDLVQGDVQNIDLGVLAAAYHQRDKLAVEIVHETADYLAAGINNVINLFDPQIVVIGGPLQLLGDSFLNRIRLRLKIVSLRPGREADVHYAVLHEQVVHLGGVRYVLDHVIDFAHCMEHLLDV
ncbi:MAG: ROK family protein, partial [Ruminococcaceae bacterium]|nr:ROK family protein [Oscillospiraceae bacterium]